MDDDKNNFSPSIGIAYAPRFRKRRTPLAVRRSQDVFPVAATVSATTATSTTSRRTHRRALRTISRSPIPRLSDAAESAGLAELEQSTAYDTSGGDASAEPDRASSRICETRTTSAGPSPFSGNSRRIGLSTLAMSGQRVRGCLRRSNSIRWSRLNCARPFPRRFRPSSTQGRLDPLQGSRSIRTNGGSSSYNSFQAEAKRRFANGFQFNVLVHLVEGDRQRE